MAKFSQYINDTSISDGSGSFRAATDNSSAITSAASGFQSSVGNLELAKARYNAAIDAEGKKEGDKHSRLMDENRYVTFEAKVQSDLEQQKRDAAVGTGEGFEGGAVATYDALATEHLKAVDPARRAEYDSRLVRLRAAVVKEAASHQTSLEYRTIATTAAAIRDTAAAKVALEPELFDTALADVTERAKNLSPNPRVQGKFIEDVRRSMEVSRLSTQAARDPEAFLRAVNGVTAAETTGATSKVMGEISTGAQASGMPESVLGAIGWLESKHNPSVRPIGKDGRPMSSAAGTFQILDNNAYGIKDKFNTTESATKVGLFLGRVKENLAARGVEATPGMLYMYHNVGEGVANMILRVPGDTTMGAVLNSVYGQSRMKNGELWQDVVGRNNPSMYKPGMTVDKVLDTYERKMAGATAEVAKIAPTPGSTDETSRSVIDQFTGGQNVHVGAKDLLDTLGKVKGALEKQNKSEEAFRLGRGYATGATRLDVSDPSQKKIVDDYIRNTNIYDGLTKGDDTAYSQAREVIRNVGFVPKQIEMAAGQVVLSSGGDAGNRAKAFAFLSNIRRDNPAAWNASGVDRDKDIEARVDDFRTATEVRGKDAASAIAEIDFKMSPEGRKRADTMKQLFASTGKGELKSLKFDDVAAIASKDYWRTATALDDATRSVIESDYKDEYKVLREQGEDAGAAKAKAAATVAGRYQPTTVFRSGFFDRAGLMAYPPEQHYPPVDADAPYKWIETQGKEKVKSFLDARTKGWDVPDATGVAGSDPVVKLIPTANARREVENGKAPSYILAVRNPKTGMVDVVDHSWTPDATRATREFNDDVTNARTARKVKSTSTPSISDVIAP